MVCIALQVIKLEVGFMGTRVSGRNGVTGGLVGRVIAGKGTGAVMISAVAGDGS